MSRGRMILSTLAFLVMLGILFNGMGDFVERRAHGQVVAAGEDLRDEVREIRSRLDDCLAGLDQAQVRFDERDRETRLLREEVAVFEALDEDGVPAARYQDYLEVFDEYNASVPRWEERARILRNTQAECRRLAEAHNAQADSLARYLVGHGLWEEEWLPSNQPSAPGTPP